MQENSGEKRRREQKAARAMQMTRTVQGRTLLLMLLCGVGLFALLVWYLFGLMVLEHDKYEREAIVNQTARTNLSARRGNIYDRNMNVLAATYSVETVYLNPVEIRDNEQDISLIASGLSRILDVEEDFVRQQAENTKYYYRIVKKKISAELSQAVREFINSNEIVGIHLEPAEKRYYPYSSLAAQVVGFLSDDDVGTEGLEFYYNTDLTGTAGSIITTRGNGTTMPYTYEKYYDAEDGHDLVLTLDTTVQFYLEKNLQNAIDKYTILNGAFGLVMDVNTAEILGMATLGSYDPNNRLEIYDTELAEQLENMYLAAIANPVDSEAYKTGLAAYNNAVGAARLKQWRNRTISDGYEPGSTFKLITMAAALNEGIVDLDDTFMCKGAKKYEGRTQVVNCWKHEGHGLQTTSQALGNSCNIALSDIGVDVGVRTFYDYVKAFGFLEKTNIDLPGEGKSLFFPEPGGETGMSVANLISAAWGQTFRITPVQLVRAVSALVNGGYLMEPYIVSDVLDGDGNVITHNEPTVIRQVISEETSATMRSLMEKVVTEGTAGKAKTAGYAIGGKTGTSEKIDEYDENGEPTKDKMVSFIGVAPIDDPKYVTLVVLDTPSRETGLYISGGIMAAPTVRDVFTDILPYLGVEPNYGDGDISAVNVSVPSVVGMSLADAQNALKERSLTCRVVGEGSVITGQIPALGAEVPGNSEIIVYMDAPVPGDMVTVPSFMGMTVSQAKQAAVNAGLYIQARGTDTNIGYITVTYQSIEGGTEVKRGSTIAVEFTDNSIRD